MHQYQDIIQSCCFVMLRLCTLEKNYFPIDFDCWILASLVSCLWLLVEHYQWIIFKNLDHKGSSISLLCDKIYHNFGILVWSCSKVFCLYHYFHYCHYFDLICCCHYFVTGSIRFALDFFGLDLVYDLLISFQHFQKQDLQLVVFQQYSPLSFFQVCFSGTCINHEMFFCSDLDFDFTGITETMESYLELNPDIIYIICSCKEIWHCTSFNVETRFFIFRLIGLHDCVIGLQDRLDLII